MYDHLLNIVFLFFESAIVSAAAWMVDQIIDICDCFKIIG